MRKEEKNDMQYELSRAQNGGDKGAPSELKRRNDGRHITISEMGAEEAQPTRGEEGRGGGREFRDVGEGGENQMTITLTSLPPLTPLMRWR